MEIEAQNKKLIRGDVLCRQGEPVHSIFNLKSGELEVIVTDFNARSAATDDEIAKGKVVAVIDQPNTLLGEAGAFLKQRSASLRSRGTSEVEVFPISSVGFKRTLKQMPGTAMKLARNLARRIKEANRDLSAQLDQLTKIRDLEVQLALNFHGLVEDARATAQVKEFEVIPLYKLGFELSHRSMEAFSGGDAELTSEGQIELIDSTKALMRSGDEAETAFLVLSGRIGVYMGKQYIYAINPGDFVGEFAVLLDDHAVRSADAIAMVPSKVLKLTRVQFEAVLRSKPELMANLVESLSNRLENANRLSFSRDEAMRDAVRRFTRPTGILRDFTTLKRVFGHQVIQPKLTQRINEFVTNNLQVMVDTMEDALRGDFAPLFKEFTERVPSRKELFLGEL